MDPTRTHGAPGPLPLAVLIVMWDREAARLFVEALRRNGDAAEIAGTSEEAWERLKQGGLGLVVLDLTAPDLDELFLLRSARSTVETLDMPFLFLIRTGCALPPLVPLASEMIRDGWLAKARPAAAIRAPGPPTPATDRPEAHAERSGSEPRP